MAISSERLISLHPTLFHVSLASWEQVEEHGLLSTSALLDLYGEQQVDRATLERKPRTSVHPIRRESDGARALLNDQSPWTDSVQRRCTLPDGMIVADYMHYLNQHVFSGQHGKDWKSFTAQFEQRSGSESFSKWIQEVC